MTANKIKIKSDVTAEPLPTLPKKSERNMGVELFRVISMMMVVMLHILGQGGALSSTAYLSVNYKVALFLQVITYCSVNCYAIISGFANVKTEFKFRRFFYLWFETVFLLLLTNTVFHFFVPSVTVKRDWWLNAFFPLIRREYWYLCAYFFMFPLIPVLNKGLASLKQWQHILIIFSLQLPTVFRLISGADNYVLGGGYSTIWLICLYVIGAYFRLYGAPKWAKRFVTLPIFFLSAFGAWFLRIYAEMQLSQGLITKDAELYTRRSELISYISPCMVIMATMLLLFFMQVKIKGRIPKTVISYLGKSTWGVFALHVSAAFWYWRDFWSYFKRFGDFATLKMLLAILAATLVVYLALSLVVVLKLLLFKYCRIDRALNFVSELPAKGVALLKETFGVRKEVSEEASPQ